MELRHFRYFVAVAENLHFARAAHRLNIVQPALSMQIKALEAELGVSLLRRNRRRVDLTEAGRLFLVEAKRTLDQASNAVAVARRAGNGTLGRIRIGYSASAIHSGTVGAAVKHFRKIYPDIHITIDQMDPWRQVDALNEGLVDVVFGPGLGQNVDANLMSYPLARFAPWVALPEDHSLSVKDEIASDLLSAEIFIEYAGSENESAAVLEYFLGFRPQRENIRSATDPVAVLALVEAGQGISVIPSVLAQRSGSMGVVYKPLAGNGRNMEITMTARGQAVEPVVAAFLKIAVGN